MGATCYPGAQCCLVKVNQYIEIRAAQFYHPYESLADVHDSVLNECSVNGVHSIEIIDVRPSLTC